jgi:hypothetical protein
MKKMLVIVLALVLSVALSVPALANTNGIGVPANVVIAPGTGNPPIIKVKWETPDEDLTKPGTQVYPPLAFQAYKPVKYWAIVTDPEGKDSVSAVYVDVWHPITEPECGSFKYQLQLQKVEKFGPGGGIEAFQQAWWNGTITAIGINPDTGYPFTYEEIMAELNECSADVYMVEGNLYYHQPAGDYKVEIVAVDNQNNRATLCNHMEYVAVAAVEIDFTSLSYGSVQPCTWKQIDGDRIFADPPAPAGAGQTNKATVRNIGNTHTQVTVHQTDLYQNGTPLGKTGDQWNVEYAARLGDATQGTKVNYFPCQTITLPEILPLCNTQKLDFWIHIKKFGVSGTWTSTITIGASGVCFEPCPAE